MDFEEFLQWLYSHFQKEKPPARSLHCSALSVTDKAHSAFYFVSRYCLVIHSPLYILLRLLVLKLMSFFLRL